MIFYSLLLFMYFSIVKAQTQNSFVCNVNECSQGSCEVQTPYVYGCHCIPVIQL